MSLLPCPTITLEFTGVKKLLATACGSDAASQQLVPEFVQNRQPVQISRNVEKRNTNFCFLIDSPFQLVHVVSCPEYHIFGV